MQICSDVQASNALKALAVQDPKQLVEELEWLGDAGEYSARTKGYVSAVAAKLCHSSPEVVAAAAEALGKLGSPGADYLDDVVQLLQNGNPKVKLAAVRTIGRFGPAAATSAASLGGIISSCSASDEDIKVAAVVALGQIKAEHEVTTLAKLLQDASPDVASAACCALGDLGATEFSDDIAAKMKDSKTRCAAVSALLELGVHKAGIVECLSDDDYGTRLAAVDALCKKGKSSASEVSQVLKHQKPAAKCAACLALGGMGLDGARYADEIAALFTNSEEDTSWLAAAVGGGAHRPPAAMRKPRCAAIRAIGMLGDESLALKISDLATHADWEVRLAAAEALGHLGDAARDMSGVLSVCLDDDTYPVRAKAVEALGRLGVETRRLPDMLNDKAQIVRIAALKVVETLGESGRIYSAEVAALLNDPLNSVKAAAARALAEMGDSCQCFASVIASFLNEEDPLLRLAALEVLPKLGSYGAAFKEDMEALMQDTYPPVAEAAAKAVNLQIAN
jgi:HEAT repeat protein